MKDKISSNIIINTKQEVSQEEYDLIVLKLEQFLNNQIVSLDINGRIIDVMPRFHFSLFRI